MPYSLALGMVATLVGLLVLSVAPNYPVLLVAAMMVGLGSAVFHPEASRVARMASGGRYGLAQSVFQVGGNTGQAIGPLTAAVLVATYGQRSIVWYAGLALLGIMVLFQIGTWYKHHGLARIKSHHHVKHPELSRSKVMKSLAILLALVFSKFVYLSAIGSYYTFYLIHNFGLSVQSAQVHLFFFLGAVAVGTLLGGPLGDKIGRKYVIWFSILGALPFTLMLPYANLFWTGILSVMHRPGPGIRLSGHRGLCPGVAARPGGHDRGPVLRPVLRPRRHRRRGAGRGGGRHLHHLRLQDLRLPAGDRIAGRVPAQFQGAEAMTSPAI